MFSLVRKRFFVWLLLLAFVLLLTLSAASSFAKPPGTGGGQMTVDTISYIDIVTYDVNYEFDGTLVGGLSSIVYDPNRDVYYAISDDRSEHNPSRFYTLDIDVVNGQLEVTFLDVTELRDKNRDLYAPYAIDPEGIELARPGSLLISTEGDDDSMPLTDPFINRFNLTGRQNRALPVPDKFLYSVADGNNVRDNLGFESLTVSPDGHSLYAASENALLNDGPISTLTNGSPSRVIEYDLDSKRPLHEFVYCVAPIPRVPLPPNPFADNGLVELQALDNAGTFLAMERSYATNVGNTVVLFETTTRGATDVSGTVALGLNDCPPPAFGAMDKQFLADFEMDLGVVPDNVEGLALGPMLPDGSYLAIAVSDNNFNPSQTTQFIALSVALEPAGS